MVQDELGSDQLGSSTYYFDQQDRRLWKQEIQGWRAHDVDVALGRLDRIDNIKYKGDVRTSPFAD